MYGQGRARCTCSKLRKPSKCTKGLNQRSSIMITDSREKNILSHVIASLLPENHATVRYTTPNIMTLPPPEGTAAAGAASAYAVRTRLSLTGGSLHNDSCRPRKCFTGSIREIPLFELCRLSRLGLSRAPDHALLTIQGATVSLFYANKEQVHVVLKCDANLCGPFLGCVTNLGDPRHF